MKTPPLSLPFSGISYTSPICGCISSPPQLYLILGREYSNEKYISKEKNDIAVAIICAAVIAFMCLGKAETLDFENSYVGYVRTSLPYEKLIVPVNMEQRGSVSIYTEPGAFLINKFILEEKKNGKWHRIAKSPVNDEYASLNKILNPGVYRIRIPVMRSGTYTEYQKKYEAALHTEKSGALNVENNGGLGNIFTSTENRTWYKFTLKEKKQVLFDFWCYSSMPSKMTVYDKNDKVVLESSLETPDEEDYTISSSAEKLLDKGTYYVKIEKLQESTEGEFCFNYTY